LLIYFCDLGCRLEVVKADGATTNVRSEPESTTEETEPDVAQDTANVAEPVHYSDELAAKIRESTEDFSRISTFDKFVLDEDYRYATVGELRDGYDRQWKARHGVLITPEEFLTEAPVHQR